jgi:ubiquinone/menaquinone biosynthesis C-methylase UbiE
MASVRYAKKKPGHCEKRKSKNRGQPGFVVLLVMLGLLKIASAEPRTPVPEELQYLEEPNRSDWQMPERVIDALRLQKNDVVADVGAGTGYFSRRFARQVAHVYAEDVDPEALNFLRREALAKVTVVPGKPENPMLPPNSCDVVFMCDVLHMVENRPAFLRNIIPALKPGGKVAVIEFYRRELPVGPPLWARLSEKEAEEDFLKGSFKLEKQVTFLPYQYFLIFSK